MGAAIGGMRWMRREVARLVLPLSALLVLAGCAGTPLGMEPLNVTLSALSVVEPGLLEQRYAIRLRVQNPNPAEIQVSGLSFEIDLNDQTFARGVSNRPTTIPALGEALLDVEGVSTLEGLLRQVLEMQENPERPIRYRLRGKLYGGGSPIPIPFDHKGEFRLPVPAKERAS